jgi:hypothetical protein
MLVAKANGRRSIRLRGHDYSHPGAYFVTVCAARRELLFGWISDGRVVENARIVRDCWLDLPNHYPHVSLDTFVVMPDHIHGIIILLDTNRVGDVRKDDVRAGLEARAGLKPAPSTRPLTTQTGLACSAPNPGSHRRRNRCGPAAGRGCTGHGAPRRSRRVSAGSPGSDRGRDGQRSRTAR